MSSKTCLKNQPGNASLPPRRGLRFRRLKNKSSKAGIVSNEAWNVQVRSGQKKFQKKIVENNLFVFWEKKCRHLRWVELERFSITADVVRFVFWSFSTFQGTKCVQWIWHGGKEHALWSTGHGFIPHWVLRIFLFLSLSFPFLISIVSLQEVHIYV